MVFKNQGIYEETKRRKIMAGVRTSLTEAQIEARRNHYLEKIGQGKPKAKGTKSNPLKNKDLARMLQERFGRKGNKPQKKGTGEAIAQLNQQASQTPAVNAETAGQARNRQVNLL